MAGTLGGGPDTDRHPPTLTAASPAGQPAEADNRRPKPPLCSRLRSREWPGPASPHSRQSLDLDPDGADPAETRPPGSPRE